MSKPSKKKQGDKNADLKIAAENRKLLDDIEEKGSEVPHPGLEEMTALAAQAASRMGQVGGGHEHDAEADDDISQGGDDRAEELENLMESHFGADIGETTPKMSSASWAQKKIPSPPPLVQQMKTKEKPVIEERPETGDSAESIADSFASIRDTAELRENFSQLQMQFEAMDERINLIMRERSQLPVKLEQIREENNAQFTMMLDKLMSLSEANIAPEAVRSAAVTAEELRATSDSQYTVAQQHLSAEPSASSPIVTRGSLNPTKKRFKPRK